MSRSQLYTLLFWVGAILIIVLATVFYRPAAAKTGSLLIWLNNRIYVMDIDTLNLQRVGPALSNEVMVPSPGCHGQSDTPCWVTAGENLYSVDFTPRNSSNPARSLLPGVEYAWIDQVGLSWAPDGRWLAYTVFNETANQAELQIYNAASDQARTIALGVDPTIAPAWSAGCAEESDSSSCELAYKTKSVDVGADEVMPGLVALDLATGEQREWQIPADPIFELRWTPNGDLLYSQPKRHFRYAADGTPAYDMPSPSQLANMSPDARYTVYYQPFTLADCPAEDEAESCMHVGVWLTDAGSGADERSLIYSTNLSEPQQRGLNFVPVWSPFGNGFVFFQDGKLIYYDLVQQEAAIWYKSLGDKLRSRPVFSPNEEAVAFVDNLGQGYSQYRLLVIDPRLQPIEHIIETKTGFRLLAWLPN
jgi:hypothetical protein